MESEQSFRLMADSAPVMIWRSDVDNLCTYVNRLWLEFRGRTISQELGHGWLEGVHPDDLSRCEQVFATSLVHKTPFSLEYRLRRFDGEYRTILDNGVPWFDSEAHFAGYIGSSFDISLRKEVETELIFSKEQLYRQNLYLTALHDTALGIVNQLDQSTLLETLVTQACNLIETSHGFIDIVLPEEKRLELQVGVGIYTRFIGYQKKIGEGVAGQIWLTRRPLLINDYPSWPHHSEQFLAGEFHSVMGVPLRSGARVAGVLGLSTIDPDHTFTQEKLDLLVQFADLASIALDNARLYKQVRRHAEDLEQRVAERTAELNFQRRQSEIILQNAADAIVFTNLDGQILYVNSAWERLTGYTHAEVVGANPRLLQSGLTNGQVYKDMWQTILAGNTWHGFVRNKRKGGGLYDVDLTIVPVRDAQESIQYFVGVQHDVTETLKLQSQQRRFVANAAHELRTPLTNFKTRLYLARRQPANFASHLDILDRVSDHMARLITDLLDLSRFETGTIPLHKEDVALQLIIARVLELVQPDADAKRIQVDVTLPEQPLQFLADPVRIQQLITNLLSNAVHYSADEGRVEITIELDGDQVNNQFIIIKVKDNGVGISSENLPYVFQPFYRVNEQKVGTGLGLSMAKEIVERHGGEISVTSVQGQGTCFRIKFPLIA